MSLLVGDPLTSLAFSVYENKGVFALMLGSGLSRAASIPTGWEITLDLIRRVAQAQGVKDQPNWDKWYREKTGQEPNYSALLEELASTPNERRAILHSYIEPTEEDRREGRKVPTAAHRAIAELVGSGFVRVIVTTNFDRLLENALVERGVEPTVVASADALAGAEPLAHTKCYILKLHGDYKDARILNTDQELSAYPPAYDRLLDRILDEHGLVVCGWSGEWDHALRAAFLRAPNRRYSYFWTVRGRVGAGAQEIIDHRRARVLTIKDADGFFTALKNQVVTLEQTHRQNPLTMDLLTNSTKRCLARPEYRIQLDDLFTQEIGRLLAQLDGAEFQPDKKWDESEFRVRVARYEAATEPLARMVGIVSRWGESKEMRVVFDVIRALFDQSQKVGGGLNIWLGLRKYPATLILVAAGLGMVREQRWTDFHRLLTLELHREDREPRRVVDMLCEWAWPGPGPSVWKLLTGVENHRTALSDHLSDLFMEWGKSFVGIPSGFEMLHGCFEILCALAYLEKEEETALLQAALNHPGQEFCWLPLGRIGRIERHRQLLVREMKAEPMKTALLRAGFAKSSERFLETFIDGLERFATRLSWS
jgi:hypothetical protein